MTCCDVDPDSWQWEAVPAGQVARSPEQDGPPCAHLLADGADVGRPCRLHATQALPLSGQSRDQWSVT